MKKGTSTKITMNKDGSPDKRFREGKEQSIIDKAMQDIPKEPEISLIEAIFSNNNIDTTENIGNSTSTYVGDIKKIIPTSEQTPNEKLLDFIKENNLDFQVSVFTDNYVYVEGQGFLFFDKPQLIYKAKVK